MAKSDYILVLMLTCLLLPLVAYFTAKWAAVGWRRGEFVYRRWQRLRFLKQLSRKIDKGGKREQERT